MGYANYGQDPVIPPGTEKPDGGWMSPYLPPSGPNFGTYTGPGPGPWFEGDFPNYTGPANPLGGQEIRPWSPFPPNPWTLTGIPSQQDPSQIPVAPPDTGVYSGPPTMAPWNVPQPQPPLGTLPLPPGVMPPTATGQPPIGIGGLTPRPGGVMPDGSVRPPWMRPAFQQGMSEGGDLWERYSMDRNYYKPAMQNIMGKMEDNLSGLNSRQLEAARGQAQNKIGGEYQTGMRNLLSQQARSGIRGGAAQAGMMDLAERRGRASSDFESELLLKNQDIMRNALQDYQRAVTGERYGQLATTMGMAGLYGGMESSNRTNDILERYLFGGQPQFGAVDPGAAKIDRHREMAMGLPPGYFDKPQTDEGKRKQIVQQATMPMPGDLGYMGPGSPYR